jgi:VWFA-related protein
MPAPIPLRRALAALVAALVAAAAASPAAAQGGRREPAAKPETFAERIEVRVVNLEAVVVDRDGQRIPGLAPGDFRLRVDGREVPIEFFTEIREGLAEAGPGAASGAAAATAPPSGVEPGRPVGTSYLVFVDEYLTFRRSDRDLVLAELADDLAQLGAADRMAIVAFDGRRLEMLANWTGSQTQLARALETARARPLRGLQTRAEVREVVGGLERVEPSVPALTDNSSPLGGEGPRGLTDERGVPLDLCPRIERFEKQLHKAVLAATATLRSFARPPGRRVMLLLSGGWPSSVRDYLGGGVAPESAGRCHQEGPKLYRPLYETANLLGYTLYPVDLPGPETAAVSASQRGLAGDNAGVNAVFEVHGTLLRLADETGGEAMIDGARSTALARVADDTRSYYWIGFTPEWKGDDREHEVDLEVLRPGAKVRARKGFQDLSRATEVSFMVESALLFEDLPGAHPLEVRLGPAGKGRLPLVPLEVVIPMDLVTMLPRGDHYAAELELRVAVLDESGDQNEIAVVPVKLEGPKPPPGARAVYATAVKLRREAHDLVVSLYDPLADTVLAAKRRFEP